jgi:hypothetical protein
MGRYETIRLREAEAVPTDYAPVIDAQFTEVGRNRRTLWGRVKAGLQALLWAATTGFLIPPAWVLIEVLIETLGAN